MKGIFWDEQDACQRCRHAGDGPSADALAIPFSNCERIAEGLFAGAEEMSDVILDP
jgi:hypothetical protein